MQANIDTDALRHVCQHIFLPPQLPQTADDQSDGNLLRVAIEALSVLNELVPSLPAVRAAVMALKQLRAINSLPFGAIDEFALLEILNTLKDGQRVPIHVRAQNAALIVSREGSTVIFEEFELSPQNEVVMVTTGRLIRTFPGLAVAVDINKNELADFAPSITNMITTLSQQLVSGMQPQSRKSDTDNDEFRDTTSPAAVSELFFGFLRGFGHPVTVSAISKNTREEVIWKNAKAPWRRSPMWLLIRVALQLSIERCPDGSRLLYKETMAFLMSQVLEASLEHEFASDMYYVMSAKMARRICKVQEQSKISGHALQPVLMTSIDHVLQRTSSILSIRWKSIQLENTSELDLSSLTHLDLHADTRVLLPALDEYIDRMQLRQDHAKAAQFAPMSSLIKHTTEDFPKLPDGICTDSTYTAANLQQFEQWIGEYLDAWVACHKIPDACDTLYKAMVQYHRLAAEYYVRNPEGTSLMILTIFELWIACDNIALSMEPLLSEYSAGVPHEILENLLLASSRQMERLRLVESSLRRRSVEPHLRSPDMLFEMKDPESFASQYFRGSHAHQRLLEDIRQHALQKRLLKQAEFQSTRSEYQRLDKLYRDSACEYFTEVIDDFIDPPETTQRHADGCTRCSYRRQRDALVIRIHEWPLPHDELEAEVVVFELDVPLWLAYWRDARFYLLQDVLKGERDAVIASSRYRLSSNDPHLSYQYFRGLRYSRIDLMSSCKPFDVSHYKEKNMNPGLQESDVCVPNGLRYRYYDGVSDRYVGNLTFRDTVARSCTYTLSRTQLQEFILRPSASPDGPPPNLVIASQDLCPTDMTLEEYKELSSVPLGRCIQWENMALQLAMPSVDFRKLDTILVFLQCVYQAGPPNSGMLREAHQLFQYDSTVELLLNNLEAAIGRVKQNWEFSKALSLFTNMLSRILSLNGTQRDRCLRLLAYARETAFEWMSNLRDRAFAATEDQSRTMFISKTVEAALICALTFDVDESYLDALFTLPANVSALVQCSIVVEQGEEAKVQAEQYSQLLHWRYQRLLHRSYWRLGSCELGLHHAISNSWSGYVRGSAGWRHVSDIADHWYTTNTATGQIVHVNLLSGELLVDGMPLDQPPKHYRSQSLYQTLFGRSVVEVMPTSCRGFQFSTKRRFQGCEVQLGMHRVHGEEEMLTVKTTNGCDIFETIPSCLLTGAYPTHYVHDYVHWYNHKSGDVDFRPRQRAWKPCLVTDYVLRKSRDGDGWQLSRLNEVVVGSETATAQSMAKVLRPLATPTKVHCILNTLDSMLSIEIPKVRLSFLLSSGIPCLRSKEFRGMVVDHNQSIGTLIGLANMLLLTNDAGERTLLVPESSVSFGRTFDHVIVKVNQDTTSRVHVLHVDGRLNRLVDSGDIQCKLYLSYLHALTSFCLPDPFTQRTGTEQALSILGSSAANSFDQLSQTNIDTLADIARLSPSRQYYPAGMKVMQSVDWDGRLDSLAQHTGLRTRVEALFEQSHRASLFFPVSDLCFPRLHHDDLHLRRRDLIRTSSYRVSGFGAEDHQASFDKEYSSRDRNRESKKAAKVAVASNIVYRPGSDRHWVTLKADHLWERMQTSTTVYREPRMEPFHLLYDSSYITEGLQSVLTNFPALHQVLADLQYSKRNSFAIMAWLAGLAFGTDGDSSGVAQMLALLYKSSHLARIRIPSAARFSVKEGKECSTKVLRRIVEKHQHRLSICPEYKLERGAREQRKAYENRRDRTWRTAKQASIAGFVDELILQWPCENPETPTTSNASTYINIRGAMTDVRVQFRAWHDNLQLYQYLEAIVAELNCLRTTPVIAPNLTVLRAQRSPSLPGFVSDGLLFQLPPPQLPVAIHGTQILVKSKQEAGNSQHLRSQTLIDTLDISLSSSKYERQYLSDLKSSLAALRAQSNRAVSRLEVTYEDWLRNMEHHKDHVARVYNALASSVTTSSELQSVLIVQQWPRVSPSWFLQQLSYSRWNSLPDLWKRAIVDYGTALTALQQAERLVKLANEAQQDELMKEAQNVGHINWRPYDHPESLLIEIESGIMIRHVQEEICEQMCHPGCTNNAVMQLNMGEGKSSVIAPMATTRLANGVQLSRIIVAKAQSKQMAQMLTTKLGGLVDRRIYYLPFSRSLKVDVGTADTIMVILQECMRNRGTLLVQPEHILSLKLMALECYISGKEDVGASLMRALQYLDNRARDLVDESDENFSVRFELIYTMGLQGSIDQSPNRWFLAQQVLDRVKKVAPMISRQHPESLELHSSFNGAFPRIRILRNEIGDQMIGCIAADICKNGLDGLPLSRQPEAIRHAVFVYITKPELSDTEICAVEGGSFWSESTKAPLLLLRGILACGVLTFALSQKRWRVNYGLTSRVPPTKVAVPYRAKDCPSLRSEFSHPDVVILLTSLCYYYQGLDDEDLFITLAHLIDSDQADIEYQAWVRDAVNLPQAFQQIQGINLEDRAQCTSELFPALRCGKSVVDYFLASIVFPKEMKEFPKKLSASGWDIGERKSQVTTGFSGTNDSKTLLPLDIQHLDLVEQKHTNALVLEHILQEENSVELMTPAKQSVTDAASLLDMVTKLKPSVEVILDVGAQILELNNLGVARYWLSSSGPSKEAVVFVNDDDELSVVDRKGRVDRLQTSSLATRLDSCLVFLDESHTRGIDLKLPSHYRAAVTLGAGLSKDRLIQACMRMRKLGRGQTVVFCIPLEIQTKIKAARNALLAHCDDITVRDVLCWSISETHTEIRRSMPLWLVQGQRYHRQQKLWEQAGRNDVTAMDRQHAEEFLEQEALPVEARYRPCPIQAMPSHLLEAEGLAAELMIERCREFDHLEFSSSTLQEEQERELSPEIEQERQIQRAPTATPATHHMHQDVLQFALSDVFKRSSKGYMRAFDSLSLLDCASGCNLSQLSREENLLVSTDFTTTVEADSAMDVLESFQRSVFWLLSRRSPSGSSIECIMIISPYEANILRPMMETSPNTLHQYKPRTNLGFAALDDLCFRAISARTKSSVLPRSLAVQLNLFAGQLYFTSYEDYCETCRFLGLSPQRLTQEMEDAGWQLDAEGFILRDRQGRIGGESGVTQSPMKILKVFTSKIRRNGDGIARTHVGGLFEGKLFQPSELGQHEELEV